MRIISRVLFVAIAFGWLFGARVNAQSSPEAINKLAASVGFIDIVGVKLGMTLEQAVAALKAANPKFVIDVHNGELTAAGKTGLRPRLIVAHLPAAVPNPVSWGNLDGSNEAIGVQLTAPPGPLVVELVVRFVRFPNPAPVAASTLIEAVRKKYGPETFDDGDLAWLYDTNGKPLSGAAQEQRACVGRGMISYLDIRSGDGLSAPGSVIPGLGSAAINQASGNNPYIAKCVPYVVGRAEILHASPTQLAQQFWMTIHSPGLQRSSLALTADFMKQAEENLIKQQEDAGAKRAVPKL
jgi:hypothetical protein